MGVNQARAARPSLTDEDVNFDHFHILRAIGKGSFGKVCIVEKRGTGRLYAMKYMNKTQCMERDALNNVLKEVDILTTLEHPFLVNLWFSFQDEEDLFMVTDLYMGGDLRYHIQQKVLFSQNCTVLYVCEIALALEYLQLKRIVHRDVKPDNILLDEEGHAHLTDFNIATVLKEGQLASSMSGTMPYMAPEIFACVEDECVGYNYAVDWWSLGVCAYEMLTLQRPYDIHSSTSISEVRLLFSTTLPYPNYLSPETIDLITRLLCLEPGGRVSSISELKSIPVIAKLDLNAVLEKKIKPTFVPPKDHLNCDPMLELEEMIVESKPLHKKKKRLAKQRSLQPGISLDLGNDLPISVKHDVLADFKTYNREVELKKRELEKKEKQWEEELLAAMKASELEQQKKLNSGTKNIKKSSSYSSGDEKDEKTKESKSVSQDRLKKCNSIDTTVMKNEQR